MALMCFCHCLGADEMRPSLLKLSELENQRWSVSFKQPQVNRRFLNLKVKTHCTAGEITPTVGITALQENFVLNCSPLGLSTIEIEGLEEKRSSGERRIRFRRGPRPGAIVPDRRLKIKRKREVRLFLKILKARQALPLAFATYPHKQQE